jgi:transcriptional regulator with XRE-family HTH domain
MEMTKPLHDVFLENVRLRMEELGMTQRQLASELRVTPSYICQLLAGRMTPGLDVVERVAKALKLSASAILQESLLQKH